MRPLKSNASTFANQVSYIFKASPSLRGDRWPFLVFLSELVAQRPNENVVKPGMKRLSDEQAALRLGAFRGQRLAGDYVFEFQLEHKTAPSADGPI